MDIKEKRKVLYITIIFFQLFFVQNTYATKWELLRYELYGGIATCSYFGDIGGTTSAENMFGIKDIEILSSRPSLYFGARYYLKERIAIQPSFYLGFAHGSDKKSKYANRGYEFTTSFFLSKINFEYSLVKINDLFGKKKCSFLEYSKPMNKTFILYLTAGAGYAFYNVKLNDIMRNDKIRTDSLVNPNYYIDVSKSGSFTLNAGLGIKYFFVKPLAISLSLEQNSIFTDNFDGFSAKSNKNDVFWMFSFGINYRLPTNVWGKINFQKKKKDSE